MKRPVRPSSWFGTLRRDRMLFALVASLALLLGLLQPLSAARSAALYDLMVLCSTKEAPTGKLPAQGPECPLCPTGHHCGVHGAPGVLPVMASLRQGLERNRSRPLPRAVVAPQPAGEPPPSIRAPPLRA